VQGSIPIHSAKVQKFPILSFYKSNTCPLSSWTLLLLDSRGCRLIKSLILVSLKEDKDRQKDSSTHPPLHPETDRRVLIETNPCPLAFIWSMHQLYDEREQAGHYQISTLSLSLSISQHALLHTDLIRAHSHICLKAN